MCYNILVQFLYYKFIKNKKTKENTYKISKSFIIGKFFYVINNLEYLKNAHNLYLQITDLEI